MCCSASYCVEASRSVLQCVAACCSVMQHYAACCSVLQRVAAYLVLLQRGMTCLPLFLGRRWKNSSPVVCKKKLKNFTNSRRYYNFVSAGNKIKDQGKRASSFSEKLKIICKFVERCGFEKENRTFAQKKETEKKCKPKRETSIFF